MLHLGVNIRRANFLSLVRYDTSSGPVTSDVVSMLMAYQGSGSKDQSHDLNTLFSGFEWTVN